MQRPPKPVWRPAGAALARGPTIGAVLGLASAPASAHGPTPGVSARADRKDKTGVQHIRYDAAKAAKLKTD
jgi:hypothetical protein